VATHAKHSLTFLYDVSPGNRWLLNLEDGTPTNMHSVWDSVGFAWGNEKQSMRFAPCLRHNDVMARYKASHAH
jgi:hypothetical protein